MSPYWISAAMVVAGMVLLAVVLLRAYRAARTVFAVRGAVRAVISNELGLLRARKAALDVAMNRRRRLVRDEGVTGAIEGRP